jgi:hypothetical protein
LARATRVVRHAGGGDAGDVALDVGEEDGNAVAESCSAMSCSDFVFPVPVAPAMSPCRFTIESGMPTSGSPRTGRRARRAEGDGLAPGRERGACGIEHGLIDRHRRLSR